MRLSEVLGHGILTPHHQMTPLSILQKVQEDGLWMIPIDQITDCRDLFQLVVGTKGVPQDRYQRLYILTLREDRVKGCIRHFYWIPTTAMLADCLTKSMLSALMFDLMQHGYWQFDNKQQDPMMARELRIFDYNERDLQAIDKLPPKPEYLCSGMWNDKSEISISAQDTFGGYSPRPTSVSWEPHPQP